MFLEYVETNLLLNHEREGGLERCLKTCSDKRSKCWQVNEAFEPIQYEQAECLINEEPGKKIYIARNRPRIEDKHMRATGCCQYLLSYEYNGPLIRTMITLEQLSLSPLTAESPHSYHFN